MGHQFLFTVVVYFRRFVEHDAKVKIIEMELAMVYDDLYTKAVVFRTWTGTICRCVVQISTVVAFVLFHANRKESYSAIDVAITYALLAGSIFMELVSILAAMTSPWAWAFLKARDFRWLTYMLWSIFSTLQPEKRLWWSNSMGQYNLLSSIVPAGSATIVIIGNIMNAIGLDKLWRKLWLTKHVGANNKIMACVVQWLDKPDRLKDLASGMRPRLGTEFEIIVRGPFEHAILQLHLFTDYHIRGLTNEEKSRLNSTDGEMSNLVKICEEISNYMLYLLVVNPSMLPGSTTSEDTLALFPDKMFSSNKELIPDELNKEFSLLKKMVHNDWNVGRIEGKILLDVRALLDYPQSRLPNEELMVEMKEIWIRLLVYAAGKSQAEAHAQQMSKGGGELLTFVWLLMGAHYELGDVARRLDLVSSSSHTVEGDRFSAFNFPST